VLFVGALVSLGISSCKDGETVELTILHTNDLHYSLHPPKSDEFALGGMARLATLIKTRRAENPLSVTLDAGDWSEGNWYFDLDAGATMLKLFGVMGYDAAVVGNHDYLSGPAETAPGFPVLGANFDLDDYDDAEKFRGQIPGTTILERKGLKIGVIGLSTVDYVFSFWLNPVKVSDPVAVAQKQAELLRPQVDVLILLSHNSFSTNEQLARAVYGVDAVISGHSHKKLGKAILVENAGRQVPVVETGSWGRFLGELKLDVDPARKVVRFKDYHLNAVLPELTEDPDASALVAGADAALTARAGRDIHEVIGTTEIPIGHLDSHTANLSDIVTHAFKDGTGADAALDIISLTSVYLANGDITLQDAHDVMPHIFDFKTDREWTVKVLEMRGQDLALFLNLIYFTNTLPLSGTGFFSHAGIEVDWRAKSSSQPVAEIRAIRVGGVPFDVQKRYRIALADGLLLALTVANEKANLGMDLTRLVDTGVEAWRMVVPWIQANSPLTEAKLRAGAYSRSLTADAGIAPYGIRAVEREEAGDAVAYVEVEIYNDGLTAMSTATLTCDSGMPNDPILFNTSEQKWDALDEVKVKDLLPGEHRKVLLPIDITEAGRWPVQCQLQASRADADGYPGNDQAHAVLEFSQKTDW
jgi:2',3'-cyclic-nucleotide 2'-phosphodiesterase (5'-nucleotidase family)